MADPTEPHEAPNANEPHAVVRLVEAILGEEGGPLDPDVRARLELLAEVTHTTDDGVRMVRAAEAVFALHDSTRRGARWTEVERRTVLLGCLLADIGKSGPAGASAAGQRLVAEMFAVEGVDDEQQPVSQFLARHFPDDADARTALFCELGLDPAMSMRAFWNLHAGFTYDVLDAGGLPPETVAAAAAHHYLDGVNPDGVVAADGRFSRWFGENVAFDRAEKLITLLDKYDAARRRGNRTHEAAIAWLRDFLARREPLREDPELARLVDELETALPEAGADA